MRGATRAEGRGFERRKKKGTGAKQDGRCTACRRTAAPLDRRRQEQTKKNSQCPRERSLVMHAAQECRPLLRADRSAASRFPGSTRLACAGGFSADAGPALSGSAQQRAADGGRARGSIPRASRRVVAGGADGGWPRERAARGTRRRRWRTTSGDKSARSQWEGARAGLGSRISRRQSRKKQHYAPAAQRWQLELESPSVGRVSANPDTRFEPQSPTLIRLAAKALGRNQLVPYGPRDGQALGLLGPSGRQHKDSRTRTIGQDVPRTQNPSAPWAAPLLLLVPVERLPSSVMGRSLKTVSSPPSSSLLVQQAATAACCDRQ